MSKTPSIMSIVAKNKLKATDNLGSQAQQGSSFSDVELEISEDSVNVPIIQSAIKQLNQRQETGANKGLASCARQQNSQDAHVLKEAKLLFIVSQKSRLKALYPTFRQADIQRIAEQVWQQLPAHRRQHLCSRVQTSIEGEGKHQINDESSVSSELDKDNHSNSETKNEKGKSQPNVGELLNSDALNNARIAERQQEVDESRRQSSRESEIENSAASSRSRSIDGQSNEETNASSAVADNSNIVCLPPIYALVEHEQSELNDSSVAIVHDKVQISQKLEDAKADTSNEKIQKVDPSADANRNHESSSS